MARLHANRHHKPGRMNPNRPGMKIATKEGIYRTPTWPYQKKDPRTGKQSPVPGIIVDGVRLA